MKSTKAERDSNIELYRIVVCLFVLIVHFNGYFIGLDTKRMNFFCIPQIIIESFTVIAVNGFILISGYFGINNALKSLWKLYRYMICITAPLMIATAIYQGYITSAQIIKALLPFSSNDNYFINGYILMVVFSSSINTYVQKWHNGAKKGGGLLICLILLEFWYDCIWNLSTFGFNGGYSGLHFFVLYIINTSVNF